MKRGSIVALGTSEPLLPTYRFESFCRPVFLGIFLNWMRKWGVPVNPKISNSCSDDIRAILLAWEKEKY